MTGLHRLRPPANPSAVGRTVIEASAGTGKTFTISTLVTRLIAEEGVPLEEILVVTFTNAATAELRDRVRKRLVATLQGALEGHNGVPPQRVREAELEPRPKARPSSSLPQTGSGRR